MSGATIVAAFVGGPLAGEVRQVDAFRSVIDVPVVEETAVYVWPQADPVRQIPTRVVRYVRHDLVLFNRPVTAFLPYGGLDREDRDRLIFEAFLTPLAKGLIS